MEKNLGGDLLAFIYVCWLPSALEIRLNYNSSYLILDIQKLISTNIRNNFNIRFFKNILKNSMKKEITLSELNKALLLIAVEL